MSFPSLVYTLTVVVLIALAAVVHHSLGAPQDALYILHLAIIVALLSIDGRLADILEVRR